MAFMRGLSGATVGLVALLTSGGFVQTARADEKNTHLFILSGQSNMAGLKPELSFTPTLEEALAPDRVVVVKDAASGQPIRRWYKKWKPEPGKEASPGPGRQAAPEPGKTTPSGKASSGQTAQRNTQPGKRRGGPEIGGLYDRLMTKVRPAVEKEKPDTITFVWMQGERDAKEKHSDVYAESLRGVIQQLRDDLGRKEMRVVIGRLSDYDAGNKKGFEWDEVRKAQVEVAEGDPLAAWVDTDDLNGERDALHYTKEGYVEMGKRFADKALKLLGRQ